MKRHYDKTFLITLKTADARYMLASVSKAVLIECSRCQAAAAPAPLTSAAAGSTLLSRSVTAPASALAAPIRFCPLPTSFSISAASSFTPLDISVRLEEMVVMAQPTAV